MQIRFHPGSSLVCIAILLGGCNSLDKSWTKKLPWSPESKLTVSEYKTPTRLAAMWTPDVLSLPDRPPVRGFGGRFYFYDETNQPVPVDGQLVVYAFDDTNKGHSANRVPDKKYAFTPDQLTQHFSTTELGASYSVWIPWDAVGGPQRSIALLPVFTSTSGNVVIGQQALNVLPGQTLEQEMLPPGSESAPHMSAVQPVSHTGSTPLEPLPQQADKAIETLRTTTIKIPKSLQQRLEARGQESAMQATASASPPSFPLPAGDAYQPALTRPSTMESAAVAAPPSSSPTTHSGRSTLPAPASSDAQSGLVPVDWRQRLVQQRFALRGQPIQSSRVQAPVTWSTVSQRP